MNANTSLMYDALHAAAGPALRAWMDMHRGKVDSAMRGAEPARITQFASIAEAKEAAKSEAAFIVNEPAFRAWFGKSAVVDTQGKPLLVYHGTDAVFDSFAIGEDGVAYFTPDSRYGYLTALKNVIPAYLSIQRPYFARTVSQIEQLRSFPDAVEELKAEGYDGVIYANPSDLLRGPTGWGNDFPQIVVFRAGQIRSAVKQRFPSPIPAPPQNALAGFDAFPDVDEEVAPARDFRQGALDVFRAHVGVEPTIFPASEVLRERDDEIESGAYYTAPYMKGVHEVAWLVFAPGATTAAEAESVGRRVLRKMLPRTKLPASSPRLLESTLYIGFPGGTAAVTPQKKSAPERTGPTLTERKEEIVRLLEPFGRGVRVSGNEEEGYKLTISPTLRAHKFRTYTSPTRPLDSVLDAARDLAARVKRTGGDVNAVMRGEGRGA